MISKTWLFLVLVPLFIFGCAGRDIHPDLHADAKVLVRQWTYQTANLYQRESGNRGTEYSNALMVDNTLVFGSRGGGLTALYPIMEQVRWKFPVVDGVISEIYFHDGSLYFGGHDGNLYSVNFENGQINWKYSLRNPMVSRPTVFQGRLFVTTSDDTTYALDAGSGEWIWHYRRRSETAATIHGACTPIIFNNQVITAYSDGYMVALSLEDGKVKWEKRLNQGRKFIDIDAKPVLHNGMIYIPAYDGALYAIKPENGEIVWCFDVGGIKSVDIDDEKIFLPSSDGNVYAIQLNDAKLLWKFELDGGVLTQLVVTEKEIFFGSTFQYLYGLDKNTGAGIYRFDSGNGSGFASSPAYDRKTNRFYLMSTSGNLYSFFVRQPRTKELKYIVSDPYVFFEE